MGTLIQFRAPASKKRNHEAKNKVFGGVLFKYISETNQEPVLLGLHLQLSDALGECQLFAASGL